MTPELWVAEKPIAVNTQLRGGEVLLLLPGALLVLTGVLGTYMCGDAGLELISPVHGRVWIAHASLHCMRKL